MIRLLLLILGILTPFALAEAKTPLSREVTAVIKEVLPDEKALRVTFWNEGEERALFVRWTRLSTAYENGKEISFERLRPGLTIRLRYGTPQFGDPVIRRIVLQGENTVSFWHTPSSYLEPSIAHG